MNKIKTLLFISMAAFFLLLLPCASSAQANNGHIFHVNTQYMVGGLDSAGRAERNAMMKEYFEKVDMKNELILHEWNATHFFSEDSREFVTIYEYANWANIEKAFDRNEELEKQAWPDAQKRKEFLKKLNSYFTHHKDAVYHELPALRK